MENITLTKSERPIVDCRHFTWKDEKGNPLSKFSIDYVVKKKSDETYQDKDWNTRNVRKSEVEFKIFDKTTLPSSFDKKSDDEICQELKGKSLVIEQKIVG